MVQDDSANESSGDSSLINDDELAKLFSSIIDENDQGTPRNPIKPNQPPMGSHWRASFMAPIQHR